MNPTFSLSVSSWGGHKLSSRFLRSSIGRTCPVCRFESVSTTIVPSPSKTRKWSA